MAKKITKAMKVEMSKAGAEACKSGAVRSPATCEKYRAAIAGLNVGEGAAKLAKAWLEGFDVQNLKGGKK